ncbi:MAG: hypothetical protein FJX46_15800 [Alphaproteobacteria bacterium]|nr:hypothetical protein [Alphaproteobacteria bacterium]
MSESLHLAFAPLIPTGLLVGLTLVTLALLLFGAWRRAGGLGWRLLGAGAILAALANPILVEEQRQAQSDIALILVDRSPSMRIGERRADADRAVEQLKERLAKLEDIETRVLSAGGAEDGSEGTRLFGVLGRALSDVPRGRLAGVIAVTDGQVHDVPAGLQELGAGVPLHALIAGSREEGDRRLVIEEAPRFGMVGGEQSIVVRVVDTPARAAGSTARLTISRDGEPPQTMTVAVGESYRFHFNLAHGGITVLDVQVDPGPRELTLANNRALLSINGVRDRLRVLLVSGEPHAGERIWRNLLKADPSVDLVHFTILRPPEKQDMTPVRELSLIAFPTRELFEQKLHEFDLIIFDRYRRRGLLPQAYLENIVDYVRKGGAVLDSSGPSFATPLSLYRSALGDVLPARPTGTVMNDGFLPRLSQIGRRHPVTAALPGSEGDQPSWGRWFRYVEAEVTAGATLMVAPGERPLLVVERIGQGRIAQIMSDHTWLWARGFEGGGPQAELLRRIAHWLMKEPELEENDLRATVEDGTLIVTRHNLTESGGEAVVTLPDGSDKPLELQARERGLSIASLAVEEAGLYRVSDSGRSVVVAVGPPNPLELADPRATAEVLEPLAASTGGAVRWLQAGLPDLRQIRPGRDVVGRDWLGLRRNGDFVVAGVRQIPLLPALAVLMLALGAFLLAWRREGR